ncbi:hypothetical protein CYMTET_32008 [Cymbomonas tetramitiformis]|uniref:Transmembrane protein n=1 Tax=Cymbomonas tetramitiformis TaxID=36881 RepID=A0AAE0FFQ3_9CHLO|nr:hypothetical protein CYMTET_32008 [Cymbomonas tetramitiformis]
MCVDRIGELEEVWSAAWGAAGARYPAKAYTLVRDPQVVRGNDCAVSETSEAIWDWDLRETSSVGGSSCHATAYACPTVKACVEPDPPGAFLWSSETSTYSHLIAYVSNSIFPQHSSRRAVRHLLQSGTSTPTTTAPSQSPSTTSSTQPSSVTPTTSLFTAAPTSPQESLSSITESPTQIDSSRLGENIYWAIAIGVGTLVAMMALFYICPQQKRPPEEHSDADCKEEDIREDENPTFSGSILMQYLEHEREQVNMTMNPISDVDSDNSDSVEHAGRSMAVQFSVEENIPHYGSGPFARARDCGTELGDMDGHENDDDEMIYDVNW